MRKPLTEEQKLRKKERQKKRMTDPIHREQRNQKERTYYANNREQQKARFRERGKKPEYRAVFNDWRNERRKDPEYRESERRLNKGYGYVRKYGITLEQRDRLLEMQGNVCAFCGLPGPNSKRGWYTDHDHTLVTAKHDRWHSVRGILHFSCNMWLGTMGDNLQFISECLVDIRDLLTRYLTVTFKETQNRIMVMRASDVP